MSDFSCIFMPERILGKAGRLGYEDGAWILVGDVLWVDDDVTWFEDDVTWFEDELFWFADDVIMLDNDATTLFSDFLKEAVRPTKTFSDCVCGLVNRECSPSREWTLVVISGCVVDLEGCVVDLEECVVDLEEWSDDQEGSTSCWCEDCGSVK